MKLYDNIKSRRKALGMSQQELAEAVGYTDRSSIAKIEKGDVDLSESKINAFAKALRVSPGELMGYDGCVDDTYYIDPEVAELAQEISENKDLRMLFSASRDVSAEDLQVVTALVKKLKGDAGE